MINRKIFEITGLVLGVVILTGGFLWWVLPTDVAPAKCDSWETNCLKSHIAAGLASVRYTVSFWSVTHLVAQIISVIFGIIATIAIGLLDDNNKHWTKPIGLFSSTFVAGLTSGIITLQVPERVDRFVDSLSEMTITANRFFAELDALTEGAKEASVQKRYETDAKFRLALDGAVQKGVNAYNLHKISFLKIGGTATKLRALKVEEQTADVKKK